VFLNLSYFPLRGGISCLNTGSIQFQEVPKRRLNTRVQKQNRVRVSRPMLAFHENDRGSQLGCLTGMVVSGRGLSNPLLSSCSESSRSLQLLPTNEFSAETLLTTLKTRPELERCGHIDNCDSQDSNYSHKPGAVPCGLS